jgi:hypothetical protein
VRALDDDDGCGLYPPALATEVRGERENFVHTGNGGWSGLKELANEAADQAQWEEIIQMGRKQTETSGYYSNI